jgi:subtilisin family serine protease
LKQDPLLPNQWHIQNTGQDAFASTLPVQGNDMNVAEAWTAGFSGKGIRVGVVDTGLEAAHEDLQANVDLNSSHNFLTGTHDPSPSGTGFDHGTSVSGIIGAVAFNDKGGRGIAYNATLRGYNLIAPGAFSVANMAQALGGSTVSVDNDLFNASFGPVANAIPQFSGAFQKGIRHQRLRSRTVSRAEGDRETRPLCRQCANPCAIHRSPQAPAGAPGRRMGRTLRRLHGCEYCSER